MDQAPRNPEQNALAAGVTEDDLLSAISRSGYPLQSIAVDTITSEFVAVVQDGADAVTDDARHLVHVQEEWSYVEPDSGSVRHIDALVSVSLIDPSGEPHTSFPDNPQSTIRQHLSFLIECKQAELPFIFFLRDTPTGKIPGLVGLPHPQLSIEFDKDSGIEVLMSMYDTLGLYDLPIASCENTAVSMTRTFRKGSGLELSGEEAFRSITYPLVNSFNYYCDLLTPKDGPRGYHDLHSVIPLAVLRAPMVGVHMDAGEPRMEAVPWVRLVRVDPGEESFHSFARTTAVDVVHIDFLREYTRMALDSANETVARINKFAIAVLTGEARTPMPGDTPGDRDVASENAAPFLEMQARISEEQFMAEWRKMMMEMHNSEPES